MWTDDARGENPTDRSTATRIQSDYERLTSEAATLHARLRESRDELAAEIPTGGYPDLQGGKPS